MSDKIKELKIKNHKKKIKSIYGFLGVVDVSYGKEDNDDMSFCRMAHNSLSGTVHKYKFSEDGSVSVNEKNRAYFDAMQKLKEICFCYFSKSDFLVFSLQYNNEEFRVICEARKFLDWWDEIRHLDRFPTIFNKDHSCIVSIIELEYEFEVFAYKEGDHSSVSPSNHRLT